jgi:acetolactate synthase-1/2/3 large subunit
MLRAISKAAFRVESADTMVDTLRAAAETALCAPRGPVSIEIPIDIQSAVIDAPEQLPALSMTASAPAESALDALAELTTAARRPVLLLGGGARGAEAAAAALADLGIAVVTSTNGRGVVAEGHPLSLGAFNCTKHTQDFYDSCDLMIVVGSRLRSNETWTYQLRLPEKVAVIDVDPSADGRTYPNHLFVAGDAVAALDGLLARVRGRLSIDPVFAGDVAAARAAMHERMTAELGPYERLVEALQERVGPGTAWVRDVTISNSTWGNRHLRVGGSRMGVHAVGGGIGQGLPMGVGAALAAKDGAVVLCGDGGLSLCLGELATLAELNPRLTLVVMNDAGYGVIRNIQDAYYGGRRYYSNILTPDFGLVARSVGLRHEKVDSPETFAAALESAERYAGATVIEVDMTVIGPYPYAFAGPPKKVG